MLGQLVEVRPGRRLYVDQMFGNPGGALADCRLVALLVHGAIAHSGQVRTFAEEQVFRATIHRHDVCAQYDEQVKALVEEGVSTVTYDAFNLGQSAVSRPCDAQERLRVCGPHEYYQDLLAVFDLFTQGKASQTQSPRVALFPINLCTKVQLRRAAAHKAKDCGSAGL